MKTDDILDVDKVSDISIVEQRIIQLLEQIAANTKKA